MKKRGRLLIGGWTGVSGGTITPTLPRGSRVRELWLEFTGDAAAGVTPSFDAMGEILLKQTGPGNKGQLAQHNTLAALALQQNRRGGIVDASYTAGGACYGSYCIYYAYERGDKVNCLHFIDGQGLALQFGATGGGAAVWDSLTVELYAVLAKDQDSMQFYVPHTSQRQITLGGTVPIDMEDNLLEYSATAGSVSNPTFLQLMTGTEVEDEGSWEGLKRQANSEYPIEATQTTLQSILIGEVFKPVDVLEMVRSGTTLRLTGGSGTTQLFQRFVDFNAEVTATSIREVAGIADAKRRKLLEGTDLDSGIKQLALPAISPIGSSALTQTAARVAGLTSAPVARPGSQSLAIM